MYLITKGYDIQTEAVGYIHGYTQECRWTEGMFT